MKIPNVKFPEPKIINWNKFIEPKKVVYRNQGPATILFFESLDYKETNQELLNKKFANL